MREYPTYLIHYGIQGQKWYERRFQNEDGTYTEEGLERRRAERSQGSEKFDPDKRITPASQGSSSQSSDRFDPDRRIPIDLNRRMPTSNNNPERFDPDKRIDPSQPKDQVKEKFDPDKRISSETRKLSGADFDGDTISPKELDRKIRDVLDRRLTPETQKILHDIEYDQNGNITRQYQAWLQWKQQQEAAERDIRKRIM